MTVFIWFEPGWKRFRAGRSTKDKVYGVGVSPHDAFWDYIKRRRRR